MPNALLQVIAPTHAAMPNASIEVMVNCFRAQTSGAWRLTIVSDGPDARAEAVVRRYAREEALRFLATDRAYGDHGHTPREVGLHADASPPPWTVLTGVDNYYVPLYVETLAAAIAAHPDVGLVYHDFLLDMKARPPSRRRRAPRDRRPRRRASRPPRASRRRAARSSCRRP